MLKEEERKSRKRSKKEYTQQNQEPPPEKQTAATIHFSIYLLDLTIISISYDPIAHWDILVNIRALGKSQEVAFQQ